MKRMILLFFCCYFFVFLGQELEVKVRIDAKRLNINNPVFFKNLEDKIALFLNQTRFGSKTYQANEKIQSTWNFILLNGNIEEEFFSGYLEISSQRPVYLMGAYYSPLLILRDEKLFFNYKNDDFLELRKGFISTNFVALLSFYAYVIIGFDEDSFSELGGNWAFVQAQEQYLGQKYLRIQGWESKDFRSRFIEQFDVGGFLDFRKNIYKYHRLGLDVLVQKRKEALVNILESLEKMKKTVEDFASLPIIFNFVQAKEQEIIQLFENESRQQKDSVYQIMRFLDTQRPWQYDRLLK